MSIERGDPFAVDQCVPQKLLLIIVNWQNQAIYTQTPRRRVNESNSELSPTMLRVKRIER